MFYEELRLTYFNLYLSSIYDWEAFIENGPCFSYCSLHRSSRSYYGGVYLPHLCDIFF